LRDTDVTLSGEAENTSLQRDPGGADTEAPKSSRRGQAGKLVTLDKKASGLPHRTRHGCASHLDHPISESKHLGSLREWYKLVGSRSDNQA